MKEYCVDLEIAKELKENGFPQETEFYWNLHKAPGSAFPLDDNLNKILESYKAKIGMNEDCYATYSAFISDEILKELPSNFINDGDHFWLYIIKDNVNNYQAYYEATIESKMKFRIIDKKLSNCLALTWLHLKKEGYIK